ncbi:ABC transporter permease, partial [Halomonas citrativorans]
MSANSLDLRHFKSIEFIMGALLVGGITLAVLLSGWLFPDGGSGINLAMRLTPPLVDGSFPLGTDPLGRDVLARVVIGGEISLKVGFYSALGAVVLGIIMGLLSGYYGGIVDMLVMRFADVQLALPFILLAITFIAVIGGGLTNMIILLIISQWVQYARLVRGSVLSLKDREFILSAQAIGVRDWRILFQHLLPNLLGPVVVLMTLNVANNILLESSLTFLGLGVDPVIPSWGGMLAEGRT